MTSDILTQMAAAHTAEFNRLAEDGIDLSDEEIGQLCMAAALRKGAESLNSQQRNGDVAIVMTSIAEQAK